MKQTIKLVEWWQATEIRFENCFIDQLLRVNDNILLKAEGTIAETLKLNGFQQHFYQQTNSYKKTAWISQQILGVIYFITESNNWFNN